MEVMKAKDNSMVSFSTVFIIMKKCGEFYAAVHCCCFCFCCCVGSAIKFEVRHFTRA